MVNWLWVNCRLIYNLFAMPDRPIKTLLTILTVLLFITSGCLLKRTYDYKQANRQLLLQNDSLKAVVIDLTLRSNASNVK